MTKKSIQRAILTRLNQKKLDLDLPELIKEYPNHSLLFESLAGLLRENQIVFNGKTFFLPESEFFDSFGDLERVLEKYKLPQAYPEAALKQARRLRASGLSELKKRPRVEAWVVTIDSETAKDLDDAISVKKLREGWELGVHIADVSFFVPRGSALDREAFNRGTSVYLNRHVNHMLPSELSADLCSLRAGEDRLTLSVFVEIDQAGKVRATKFEKTRIKVARRFSYNEFEAILQGEKDSDSERVKEIAALAESLRRKRHSRGGLEFEIPEVRIELDPLGDPIKVLQPKRNQSEMIIEDFMLVANEQVASFLSRKGSSLYRIHPSPDPEKLKEFVKHANEIGLGLRLPQKTTPQAIQKLLIKIRSNPHAAVLSSLLLRTMQKAVYSTANPGHFGLAFADYTHFTSPIRRYPDLVIHRILKSTLDKKRGYSEKDLNRIAEQASAMEQNGLDAEREYARIKGARFLAKRIGEVVEGKIASITAWGMFVTLPEWGLDGLLHVSELLDDFYRLDNWGHALIGSRTGKVYSLGDLVKVRIKSVQAEKGFVDLALELPAKKAAKKSEKKSEKKTEKKSTQKAGKKASVKSTAGRTRRSSAKKVAKKKNA